MRFNVHHWDGRNWQYVATVKAENEQEAAKRLSMRFSLKGRFASYPHIDEQSDQITSKTPFTEVQ